jgi:hypothetical protein
MTGNVRLITPNEADACTLTADPVLVATLPVENLQEQSRGRVSRSTGLATPQHIYGTWLGPVSLAGFALIRHNLTGAGVVRLIIYEGQNQTGAVLYDSGDVLLGDDMPGWGDEDWGSFAWGADVFIDWTSKYVNLWFEQVTAQSFDLRLTDSGNTDGFIQASRLFLGPVYSPLENMAYGVSCGWQDDSVQEPTAGGGLRTHAVEPYRVWDFTWPHLSEGDRAQLNNFARNYGKRKDAFLSCYPEAGGTLERDHAGVVKLTAPPIPNYPFINNWRSRMTFREV